MATTTENFGLRKPTKTDFVNVDLDISANMDLIDAHAHSGTYVAWFDVTKYGAVGDGVTNDTVAIQAAIDAAEASQGIVWFPAGTYAYGGLTLPKGVSLFGTHMPSADPTTLATGSILKRTVDSIGITIHGTDRTTNRIGANRISGIRFLETDNVSSLATIDCKYADSILLENVTFWQSTSATTKGHAIAAEECWDWRLQNVIQKQCGRAASSKYGIYIYNGADDSTNDWKFLQVRFQEQDGISVFFDSDGDGTPNTLFDFVQCKFEDARGGSATATTHVDGSASNVTFYQCEFNGGLTSLCDQTGTQWVWNGCFFGGLQDSATSAIVLAGSNCKLVGCHFNDMATATLTQLMNITGGNNAVIACTQSGTVTPFNAGMPLTTLIVSPQISGGSGSGYSGIGGTPGTDKALVVGYPTSGATTQYGVYSNPNFGSDGTSAVQAIGTKPKTPATSYTASAVYGLRVHDATKGAGSTINTQAGIQIDDMTVGNANYAIRTGTGIVQFGDQVDINGTATARSAGHLGLGSGTQTTVGAAGTAYPLPTNPLGYLTAYIGTAQIAIPYYTASPAAAPVPPPQWKLPSGVVAATMPRMTTMSGQAFLTSGQQSFVGIYLEAGQTVTNIAFYSSSQAAVTPTNQWFSLYDSSLNKLAVTADDTTTAWNANTRKSLALTNPYAVTTSGWYYVGCMVAAGTVPNLQALSNTTIINVRPTILSGRDGTNTGLTVPGGAPATAAALTVIGPIPYVEAT